MKADLFVPCGGTAEVDQPLQLALAPGRRTAGRCSAGSWKGANLFITQEARLKLEEKGVVLFKDSSTNKGGVISSSLEVLAGLALSDEEYEPLMTVPPGGTAPRSAAVYIEEVIDAIRRKADQEFGLLWRAHSASGAPLSELSEAVSRRINEITVSIERSTLFDNDAVRRNALRMHVPPVLVEQVGLEALMERLPESYQRAILARTIASSFVYERGLDAGFEDYRQYVEDFADWRGPIRTDE